MAQYHQLSLRRAGTHAIASWITSHYDRWEFFGACDVLGNPRYEDAHMTSGHAISDLQLFAYEEFYPHEVFPTYVIVRDWRNMVASRLANSKHPEDMRISLDLVYRWNAQCEFARNFPDRAIIFDAWFKSPGYRRDRQISLNLPRGLGDINQVWDKAGGSSFDGTSYNGNAQAMRVLKRYEDSPWGRYPGQRTRELNEWLISFVDMCYQRDVHEWIDEGDSNVADRERL
jgi:hypothetical protein